MKFTNLQIARKKDGAQVAMNRNGEVVISDEAGRERERYQVVYGARVLVKEGQKIESGTMLEGSDCAGGACPVR